MIQLRFSMLDKFHDTCNKEMEDTSGGHTSLVTSRKMRTSCPGASHFHYADYDREHFKKLMIEDIVAEIAHAGGVEKFFEGFVDTLLTKAEEHCRDVHVGHPPPPLPKQTDK